MELHKSIMTHELQFCFSNPFVFMSRFCCHAVEPLIGAFGIVVPAPYYEGLVRGWGGEAVVVDAVHEGEFLGGLDGGG